MRQIETFEEKEWEAPKGKWSEDQRIEYLKKLLEKYTLGSLPRKGICKLMNVSKATYHRDVNKMIDMGLDPKPVKRATIDIFSTLQRSISEAKRIIDTGNDEQKLRAISVLNDTLRNHTDMLEKYGFKEQVSLLTEVKQELVWKRVIVEEIKHS